MKVGVFTTRSPGIPQAEFVVTNYETVVRRLDDLLRAGWDAVIVDEAQAIKNRRAKRSRAVHRLCHNVPYAWLLTATPFSNRPDELWSLLHALDPKRWSSYWRFVDTYCQTCPNPFGGIDILGTKNQEKLGKELAVVMLRRTRELLGLPPLSEEVLRVELGETQRRLYRQMEREFLVFLDTTGDVVVAPSVLAKITRLRQIACTPALIGGKDESAKTEALLDLLEDAANDHKVLVFTTFAEYVKNVMPKLRAYNPACIIGEMSADKREGEAARFQADPACRVLVGTIGAMGEGLNLQAASVVVFLDLHWSPSACEQAVGRAYRRGQSKPVHVIKLVATGTVDEDVLALLERKQALIREVDAVRAIAAGARRRAQTEF